MSIGGWTYRFRIVENKKSPWLFNIDSLSLPVAHGEGKYYADTKALTALNQKK